MSSDLILFITDDLHLYLSLRRRCSSLGFRTQPTSDWLYAIMKIIEEPPCLILVDSAVEGMDTFSFCKSLADNDRTRSVPVVMLVHASDQLAMQRCKTMDLQFEVRELLRTDVSAGVSQSSAALNDRIEMPIQRKVQTGCRLNGTFIGQFSELPR